MVTVAEELQKLERRLSPPDPSADYNVVLRDLLEQTVTYFDEDGNLLAIGA